MKATRRWMVGATMACAVASIWVVPACSDSQDQVTPYSPDASGTTDGTTADATGGDAAANKPLCEALGGYAAVQKLSTDFIAKMSQDCRIGAYFTSLTPDQQQHHADCFETFLASSAQCKDGTGAAILYLGSKDSHGVACKKIPEAHTALGLSKDDYTAFQQDVVAAMTDDGVPQDLRNGVIGIFNGQPGVYNANKKGSTNCDQATCTKCVPTPDAGTDGGDGGSDAGISDAADGGG